MQATDELKMILSSNKDDNIQTEIEVMQCIKHIRTHIELNYSTKNIAPRL